MNIHVQLVVTCGCPHLAVPVNEYVMSLEYGAAIQKNMLKW